MEHTRTHSPEMIPLWLEIFFRMNLRTLKREKRLPLRQEPRATRPSHNLSQCHSWPLDGSLCFLTIISLLIFPFSSVGFDFHFLELKFLPIKKYQVHEKLELSRVLLSQLSNGRGKNTHRHTHTSKWLARKEAGSCLREWLEEFFCYLVPKKKTEIERKKKKFFRNDGR